MTPKRAAFIVGAFALLLGLAVLLSRTLGDGGESSEDASQAGSQKKAVEASPETSGSLTVKKGDSNQADQVEGRSLSPKVEELKKQFHKARVRGDMDSMRELGWAMEKAASGSAEKAAIITFISKTYSEISATRRRERHAPTQQSLSDEEITSTLTQLHHEKDPTKRHFLLRKLLRSRLPESALSDVITLIDRSLGQSSVDPSVLKLLNSFVGQGSQEQLIKYAGTSYPQPVRRQALALLFERRLSPESLQWAAGLARAESDPQLRASLITILAKAKAPGSDALVLESLSSQDPRVKIAAVHGLDAADSGQREAIYGVLSDANPDVRGAGLVKLAGFLNESSVLDRVLSAAQSDASKDVRREAVGLLQRNSLRDNEKVLNTLNTIAGSDSSEEVRIHARSVLKVLTEQ